MAGRVTITTENHGRTIRVQRDEQVSDAFWLVARSEWGSGGSLPGQRVDMPVESFLDRLGWLGPACRAHGVSLDWDGAAESLVRRHRDERRGLTTFLADLPDAPNVVGELDSMGSRWSGRRELRGFQTRDLGRLLAMPHGANFSVPGAGKTAVTLALYELERRRHRVSQMLVVAPLSAFEAWQEEIAVCLDPAPVLHPFDGGPIPENAEIVLVNYQRMLLSFEPLAKWLVRADTQLCLDEALRRSGFWLNRNARPPYLADCSSSAGRFGPS